MRMALPLGFSSLASFSALAALTAGCNALSGLDDLAIDGGTGGAGGHGGGSVAAGAGNATGGSGGHVSATGGEGGSPSDATGGNGGQMQSAGGAGGTLQTGGADGGLGGTTSAGGNEGVGGSTGGAGGGCGDGFYLNGDTCVACTVACGPGTFETSPCNATTDRVCTACSEILGCAALTCTTLLDSECSTCETGTYLVEGAPDTCAFFTAEQAYVKASNANAGDVFGVSVAIDGDVMVVGATGEASNQDTITNGATASDNNEATSTGAAYVFRRTNGIWEQEAYLKASNAGTSDFFGSAVAVSGDTIAVAAYGEDSNQMGITNGASASDNNSAAGAGAVYVFKRTAGLWEQEAYLKPPNTDVGDLFGYLAISGDTIVVGAPQEDSNHTAIIQGATASDDNSAGEAGAAYVFRRSAGLWEQEAYLKASNANAGDRFGQSVAISGDTVVVGASGEASNQMTVTNGPDASSNNAAASTGAAYVFKRTGTSWAQEAYLKAPNAGALDVFGYSVGISGDAIVVGAFGEDSNEPTVINGASGSSDNSADRAGAAYVFRRTGSTWDPEAYLKPANPDAVAYFGDSVKISGDLIIVAAHLEDSSQAGLTLGATASSDNDATDAGAAYIFRRVGGSWAEVAYIKPSNTDTGDLFSEEIAISGTTIVVGAHREDSNQKTITHGAAASSDNSVASSGAVYVFGP